MVFKNLKGNCLLPVGGILGRNEWAFNITLQYILPTQLHCGFK